MAPEADPPQDPGEIPAAAVAPDTAPVAGAAPPPVAPVLPAAATVPDAAGAGAFVQHWYALVNHAYATGDSSPLAAVSHPECHDCDGYPENIAGGVVDGGVFRDVALVPEQLDTVPDQLLTEPTPTDVMITTGLVLCSQDATLSHPDGTVRGVACQEVEAVELVSQWDGDRWTARELNHLEDGQ